jgi:hypothetical protein
MPVWQPDDVSANGGVLEALVLRKPACHRTAKSNNPSTRMTVEKVLTDSQANNPPLDRGSKRWGNAAPMLRP